ncbi:hypothetical protein M011DRAFT_455268 [Sporormia fimetaria CBS 119925]|uniref:DUF7357 domain-containing protein n=1 Tax=Sporormia fimetaria CBS 119925 TaxID=1340428 RepID=A0A6A6VN95_9PLEO|nr:hypothetical protein M011DRAFT_455268 [Sporormia fimetaria CBS 119925]
MRLRLTVQRNGLPAVNLLWSMPTGADPQYYTISKFLEDLHHIVPLEAADWGLEDYVVQVGRFECVHYAPLAEVLKDEDEVVVRALSTADVRSRTLGGRYQISYSGQHLLDGVPFGRPVLRTPNRPQIDIPPRKRQRVLMNEDGDLTDVNDGDEQLHTDVSAGSEEHRALDQLRITSRGETAMSTDSTPTLGQEANGDARMLPQIRRHSTNTVRFQDHAGEDAEDDEDDDEDFVPGGNDFGSDMQDSSSDVSSDSTGDSESSVESEAPAQNSEASSTSDSDGDSSTDSESDASSGPEEMTSKLASSAQRPGAGITTANKRVPPGEGSKLTKIRNERRKLQKKVRRLKDAGELPYWTTLQAAKEYLTLSDNEKAAWVETYAEVQQQFHNGVPPHVPSMKKRKAAEQETETDDAAALEERKWKMLASLDLLPDNAEQQDKEPASKRRRLDAQEQGSEKPVTFEESPAHPDPDYYKSRIHVSAFETYHEGYVLEPPPFPFKQHWDKACEFMQPLDRLDKSKNYKKTRYQHSTWTESHEAPAEYYDAIEPDTEATSATKDDETGPPAPKQTEDTLLLDYGEITQLGADADKEVESQILQDVAISTKKPDLPAIPDDIEALPSLNPSDMRPGAVIVFKFLMLDPLSEHPMPGLSSFVTGVVESDETPTPVRLAERDKVKLVRDGEPAFEGLEAAVEGDNLILYMESYLFHEARLLVPGSEVKAD